MTVHILKLCVGAESLSDYLGWVHARRARAEAEGRVYRPEHVTRMWPKRAGEVLDGGSLYWVIKGRILCRQRIVALEPREGADGITRCALVLDPAVIRTAPAQRRPFQGWRYLAPDAAPPDIGPAEPDAADLPDDMAAKLAEIGVI